MAIPATGQSVLGADHLPLQQETQFPPLKSHITNFSLSNKPRVLPNENTGNDKNKVSMEMYVNILKAPNPVLAPTIGVEPIPLKKVAYTDGIPRVSWTEDEGHDEVDYRKLHPELKKPSAEKEVQVQEEEQQQGEQGHQKVTVEQENTQPRRKRIVGRYWNPTNRLFTLEKGAVLSDKTSIPGKGIADGNSCAALAEKDMEEVHSESICTEIPVQIGEENESMDTNVNIEKANQYVPHHSSTKEWVTKAFITYHRKGDGKHSINTNINKIMCQRDDASVLEGTEDMNSNVTDLNNLAPVEEEQMVSNTNQTNEQAYDSKETEKLNSAIEVA
ncbi:hypothetical protein KY285_030268 [Solanum tuberosum]|nr:hypothetical protein KY285_030268 [Solanum tuberosum]